MDDALVEKVARALAEADCSGLRKLGINSDIKDWRLFRVAAEYAITAAAGDLRLAGVKEGLEMAAKECRHVAENAVLVLEEHDARVRHEGIVAGANVCALHIEALGPRP